MENNYLVVIWGQRHPHGGKLGTYHPMLRLATVRWPDAVEANRHATMIDVRIMVATNRSNEQLRAFRIYQACNGGKCRAWKLLSPETAV